MTLPREACLTVFLPNHTEVDGHNSRQDSQSAPIRPTLLP
jgi:hypothetical protein